MNSLGSYSWRFLDDADTDWGKEILQDHPKMLWQRSNSLLSEWCSQSDKKIKYSRISRVWMQFKSRNVCALMDKTFSFFPSVYWNTLSWGESHVGERKERMVNLLFQETSNLLLGANVKSQKPVLRKRLGDSVLFLVSNSPSPLLPPPPLLPSSSSPLHLCPSLYYSEEGSSQRWNTPVHTGITEAAQFTSTPPCVLMCVCQCVSVSVCVSKSLRRTARDTEWFSLTDRFCHTVL